MMLKKFKIFPTKLLRSFAVAKPAECYYKTMNLSPNVDFREIKSQYLKLAKKYHPDVSQEKNKEERFKTIQEAYSVLSKADTREEYDLSIGISKPAWQVD